MRRPEIDTKTQIESTPSFEQPTQEVGDEIAHQGTWGWHALSQVDFRKLKYVHKMLWEAYLLWRRGKICPKIVPFVTYFNDWREVCEHVGNMHAPKARMRQYVGKGMPIAKGNKGSGEDFTGAWFELSGVKDTRVHDAEGRRLSGGWEVFFRDAWKIVEALRWARVPHDTPTDAVTFVPPHREVWEALYEKLTSPAAYCGESTVQPE